MMSPHAPETLFCFKPTLYDSKQPKHMAMAERFLNIIQKIEQLHRYPSDDVECIRSLQALIQQFESISVLPLFHFICQHAEKIKSEHIQLFKLIQSLTGHSFNVRDQKGHHLLHVAALYNFYDLTRFLIEEAGESIDSVNTDNVHPLTYVFMKGHFARDGKRQEENLIDYYLDNLPRLSKEKNTGLIIAAREGRSLIVDWLLRYRIDRELTPDDPRHIDYQNINGYTAMIAALSQQKFNIFQKLENFGGKPLIADHHGANAIHYLASFTDSYALADYLEKYKIDLHDYLGDEENNILNFAALNPNSEVMAMILLSTNATAEQIQKLSAAIEFADDNLAMLRLLVEEKGLTLWTVEESGRRKYLTDPQGQNALHLAILLGAHKTCRWLVEELGFDIEACDDFGATALFKAASQNFQDHSLAIMTWLIDECGAKTNITEVNGLPLGHVLARANHNYLLMRLLHEGKIDILSTDPNGLSIYDVAIIGQNLKLIESLTQFIHIYNLSHPPINIKHYQCYPKFIVQLVTSGLLRLDNIDDEGDYALHLLSKYAEKELLFSFLSLPGIDINQQNKAGESALKLILARHDDELAKQFISQFKPNLSLLDRHPQTIYERLCHENRTDLLIFLTKSSVHQKSLFDNLCFSLMLHAFKAQDHVLLNYLVNYQVKQVSKSLHPLILAIKHQELDLFKAFVLEHGLALDLKPQKNSSLLKLAASNKSNGIFSFLVSQLLTNADYCRWLSDGIKSRNLGIVHEDLIAEFIQHPQIELYCFLHQHANLSWSSIIAGKTSVFELVLQQNKAEFINYFIEHERLKLSDILKPTHFQENGLEFLTKLLALWPNVEDPDFQTLKDLNPQTTFISRLAYLICHASSALVLKIMHQAEFWELTNSARQNVFHLISINNRLDLLPFALSHYPEGLNVPDQFGRTPLHHAVAFGWEDMIQALLITPNIYLFSVDHQGQNLLHQAVPTISAPLIFKIIEQRIDLLFEKDFMGNTPWTYIEKRECFFEEEQAAMTDLAEKVTCFVRKQGFF
jgi:ankyrin repeat protein